MMLNNRVFELKKERDGLIPTSTLTLEWPYNKSLSWFILKIREAFSIIDDASFVLKDSDNCIVAISHTLPGGKYDIIETETSESMSRIISTKDILDRTELLKSNNPNESYQISQYNQNENAEKMNFEKKMLQIACADALIANERTWLAWTRTSLNIMTCSFTFIFLDDWSKTPVYTKILANSCAIGYAIGFAGCFIVGYLRYRKFSKLLYTSAMAVSFEELEVDDMHAQQIWSSFLAFLITFSSFVYLGILRRDVISSHTGIDSVD